jgi:cytochrome c-type biogenesis protein CcmE
MKSMRIKLAVAGVVLVGAFAYLAFAGMQKGWVYFVGVDQYLADPQYAQQRVRLHGRVASDGFDASRSGLTAKFNLASPTGGTRMLAVVYRGAIPDLFEAGRDVVIEGKRDATTGVFQADVLMTKCASKYEPGSPHAKAHADSKPQAESKS